MDEDEEQAKDKEQAILIINKIAEKWPSEVVARTETQNFTGGVYTPGYLANCDSKGTGPEGAFSIGRKVVYPVDKLVQWLINKVEIRPLYENHNAHTRTLNGNI